MRHCFAVAVLLSLVFSQTTFGQSSNASVSGFAQDSSQAIVPGVTITATNTQTGVVSTTLTNESGTYNFPSLLPGTYKLSATLPGFRTQIYNDVNLGANSAARYNFTMEVGGLTQAIEVSADRTAILAENSATIGQVLTEEKVRDLPLVTNDVLDLLKTMPGVRGEANAGSFAGISTSYVNTTRDGISVTENRYINGVSSTTLINPDLVGEMRVILTPVDAETGRGNGQVQILTRSGTNRFKGSAVWAVRNSALDANTWANNGNIGLDGKWSPTKPDWTNRHQATVSYGGPIVKNKTFFFALYDQQIERRRSTQRPVVLTDCARNGIFRYWEGWANGNTDTVTNTASLTNSIRPSVDFAGNPVAPTTNPNGTPYTGQLRYFSVFGPVVNTPTRPDCSDAVVQGAPWDANRTRLDPVGVSQKFLSYMPHPNYFGAGNGITGADGLNTAVHQWVRPAHSSGSLNLGSGTDTDAGRKQINVKIDQNFNSKHKVAGNFSYDWIGADYGLSTWPGGYGSELQRRPQVLTVNFTSTLSSTLLNEARVGYRKNWHVILAPWEVNDESKREVPLSLMLEGGGFPIAYAPATVGAIAGVGGMTPNSFSCMTNCAQQGNTTPLYQYGDTITWTKGKHGFKGGGEIRIGHSEGSETPTAPIPKATGGTTTIFANAAFQNNPNLPGLVTTNQTAANSLLYFLSGSVASAQQYYFIQSSDHQGQWMDYNDRQRKITDSHQNEFSLFFKDDWKVSPSFTANLGIRYDYFGVPWEGQGLTATPIGGGDALFGVSGRSFDTWLNPNVGVDTNLVTTLEFVGPKTENPGKSIYKKDRNNFGPAIGFAWNVPWFGEGKTNVRGGYQVTFAGGNRYVNLANYIFSNQGFVNLAMTTGPDNGNSYFETTSLSSLVPVTPGEAPMQPTPVIKKNVAAYAFDTNYQTPYVQNLTLSVTRQVSRQVTVDVRYIGTRGMKLYSDLFDLNVPNVYYNPALFDALNRTRNGEDVELFDQMFLGVNLNPGATGCNPSAPTATCAAVNGTTQRGSQHLRLNTTFRTNLAQGDFAAVANSLNVYNGTGSGAVQPTVNGERGTVLRRANKGFNVPGGNVVAGGAVVPAGLFPENWISANPQYSSANLFSNNGSSNYHSLQMQTTLRPTNGLSFQGTYIWSKALAVPTAGYTNPADRQKDYTLSANHVTHDFRANGTFDLPIGPNKLLFANSSGIVARLIEGWQTNFILNFSSGGPANITAGNMLYGNGVADVVAPSDLRQGEVQWGQPGGSGQLVGNYFGTTYGKVADPQCAAVAVDLRSFCTLQAVTDAATGQIVFQNPQPGSRGTVGQRTVELPGTWAFDGNIGKTFRLDESRSVQIRFDATNILNHPWPGTPSTNINSTNPFGLIASKGTQHREFKAQARLNF